MRNNKAKLEDILEEIQLIEKYIGLGRDEYDNNDLVQTWMIKRLENIRNTNTYLHLK